MLIITFLAFVKSQKVIEKEGTPRFYVRELYEIEKYVAAKWEDKEFKKKLSKRIITNKVLVCKCKIVQNSCTNPLTFQCDSPF